MDSIGDGLVRAATFAGSRSVRYFFQNGCQPRAEHLHQRLGSGGRFGSNGFDVGGKALGAGAQLIQLALKLGQTAGKLSQTPSAIGNNGAPTR